MGNNNILRVLKEWDKVRLDKKEVKDVCVLYLMVVFFWN